MEDREFAELFGKIMEDAPDDVKKTIMRAVSKRVSAILSDPEERASIRRRIEASGDSDAMERFEKGCRSYDLNVQIVTSLGNIKSMLSSFDENDHSMENAIDNLLLFKHISTLVGISCQNMKDQMTQFMEE